MERPRARVKPVQKCHLISARRHGDGFDCSEAGSDIFRSVKKVLGQVFYSVCKNFYKEYLVVGSQGDWALP